LAANNTFVDTVLFTWSVRVPKTEDGVIRANTQSHEVGICYCTSVLGIRKAVCVCEVLCNNANVSCNTGFLFERRK